MNAAWVINYDRVPTNSDETRYSDEVDSLGVPGQVGVVTIALEKQDQHPGDQCEREGGLVKQKIPLPLSPLQSFFPSFLNVQHNPGKKILPCQLVD